MTTVERGEPSTAARSRDYADLVAAGKIRLTPFTTDDLDRRPTYVSDRAGCPIQTILDMKEADVRPSREG